MAKRPKSSGVKERLYGLFALGLGIYFQYNLIQAVLHGGSFGIIKTALAPLMLVSGLVLLVKPELYCGVTTIEYSGKNLGDGRTWGLIIALAVIGLAINAWLYFYPGR